MLAYEVFMLYCGKLQTSSRQCKKLSIIIDNVCRYVQNNPTLSKVTRVHTSNTLSYPNCTRELFSYAVMRANKIRIQVSFYNIMQTRKTKIGNLFKIMQTVSKIFLGEILLDLPQKIANRISCLLLSIKKPEIMYFVWLTPNLYMVSVYGAKSDHLS